MTNLKHDILELIEKYLPGPEYLNEWGLRTNFFLGSTPRGRSNLAFSRFGDGILNKSPCLLTQLFAKWYPNEQANYQKGLLHFECMRYDCMFYREKNFNHQGYPESWEYDWLIEVENDYESEFVMTVMGLLDIVCHHRLAIFFTDKKQVDDTMSTRFRSSWRTMVSRHTFVKDFEFSILLLPASFDTFESYKQKSALIRWNPMSQQFEETA
jgi:hypothetical protein